MVTATVVATDGADETVTWSSADTDKVSISDGKIKGLVETTEAVTITATSTFDPSKKDTASVTVVGSKEEQIGAANAGTWTIGDTTFTIDENGDVTSKDGTAVTVSIGDDGKVTITIDGTEYVAETDPATGAIVTESVKDAEGKEVKVEKEEDTEEPENPDNPDNPVNPVTPDPETPAVDTTVYFTSLTFDDAVTKATENNITDKNYTKASADYTSEDGSWTIVHGLDSSAATVSVATAKSYNEDTSYTTRIQMKGAVLKLKIGAGVKKIIRIDGGSASGDGNNRTLSSEQSSDTWTSFKGSANGKVAAGFLEVTGGTDGYVTLSASNNINVYGVKVVEQKEDLSAVLLGNTVAYASGVTAPTITFDPENAEINVGGEIAVSAKANVSITPLYANGLEGTADTAEHTTFNFYVDDGEDALTTLPSTEGSHTVKAVLYLGEGDDKTEYSKISGTAKYTVKDASAAYFTVNFKDGDTVLYTEEVKDGSKIQSVPENPTKEGYSFKGWTSSVSGVTTESDITQAVDFTADWEASNDFEVKSWGSSLSTSYAGGKVVLSTKNGSVDGVTVKGTYAELAKSSAGYITITIPVTGTLVVTARSTGGTNDSDARLASDTTSGSLVTTNLTVEGGNNNNKASAAKDGVVTVSGQSPLTTITYTSLSSGTYVLFNGGSSRGTQIATISFTAD